MIRNQITQWQLTFIGKVVRNSDNQIPAQLLTAWCNHKQKRDGVLQNNNKNLVQSIRLVVPGAAKDGLLMTWIYFALDNSYWKYLISLIGNRPQEWIGEEPNPRPMPPPLYAAPDQRSVFPYTISK